ncbi:uncharacterized protein LOC129128277 [Agelaius phoeniceus]|uniref:uncharacterized protein LOC129128277 n=1 Tax=Agelaius phoeniceus TaxID=39638 RepID=UPI004054AF66
MAVPAAWLCISSCFLTSPDLDTLIRSQTFFHHLGRALNRPTPVTNNLQVVTGVLPVAGCCPCCEDSPCSSAPGAAGAGSSQPQGSGRAMPDSFAIHFLKVLRELLAFVLFSYTVLLGALLLAGWTTYFLVLK